MDSLPLLRRPALRRLALPALAAALALLLLAAVPAAEARIVPQRGMIGVRLLMKKKRVVGKLGPPDAKRVVPDPFSGGDDAEYRYAKTWIHFLGRKPSSRVYAMRTTDRHERTARGIGVGSTQAQVEARVRNVTCKREFGIRHCYVGDFSPFTRVTDFVIGKRSGRVRSVGIGIVED
ncbi:MAG: hypothetical protein U0R52_12905 [Solirubrobacterales bacterium]